MQRLTIGGTRRDLGLGGFPLVTFAEAREQAFDNPRQARWGRDPRADRRRAQTPTFEQAAGRALEANRARWRNAKTATRPGPFERRRSSRSMARSRPSVAR